MRKEIEICHVQFGLKVRSIRETLGLDQATVAKRIGQSRPSVANIEAGKQRVLLHHVEIFANALGTTPKNLLRGIWL